MNWWDEEAAESRAPTSGEWVRVMRALSRPGGHDEAKPGRYSSPAMVKPIPTILVIEDEAETRDLFARLLSAAGYNVRVAANGWEGLLALEHHVDLVLLDIMMPGMDGVVFLRTMRGEHAGRQLPVVVVTAMDVAEAAALVEKMGVRHILPKNHKLFPALKETLRRVLATPGHPYHVELPESGSAVGSLLAVYLRMLAWN